MTTRSDARKPWVLRLYVNGASPNSMAAVETVQRLCHEDLADQVELDIVDIQQHPAMVLADNIVAAPTLIKRLPGELRYLVGNLSDLETVRDALDLGPIQETQE